MDKNYEIRLSWIQLGLLKSSPRHIGNVVECVKNRFSINPPFRSRLENETNTEYGQVFVKYLAESIESKGTADFSQIIAYLEKTL